MAHPFFESTSYPWSRKDARDFHAELSKGITATANIELIYKSCGEGLPPLVQPAAADMMWTEALNKLASVRLLDKLGELLAKEVPPKPGIIAAFKMLVDAADPIQEPGIASGRIILDRQDFRKLLSRSATDNSALTVLLIRGGTPDGHGKSWTRYIVHEQAKSLGDDYIYFGQGLVATVDGALKQIFDTLGGTVPPKDSSPEAWILSASTEMGTLASRRKKKLWLVVDDLGNDGNKPKLDEYIRKLFDQVALKMLAPEFAEWIRLVLIEYPEGDLPTRWETSFYEEDRPLDSLIKEEAVTDYLLNWTKRKGKILTEEAAKQKAIEIINKSDTPLPNDKRPRLRRIHDEVAAVLKGM